MALSRMRKIKYRCKLTVTLVLHMIGSILLPLVHPHGNLSLEEIFFHHHRTQSSKVSFDQLKD